LGFLCVCLPFLAQQVAAQDETFTREQLQQTGEIDNGPALALYRPDVFSSVDGSVLIHGLPVLALLDGRRLLVSSEMGRMGSAGLDVLPLAFLSAVETQKVSASPMYGTDAPGGVVNLRMREIYGGGEMGVFYGKSGGKYGHEDFEAYIIGGVGNDKVHFTAGAAYQESNWHGGHGR
ncbi:MAG: TonB-dependent receptor plug domain-containing protein, partial [Chthoniobacterales bacterium]